jgi:hypothetical protein
MGSKKKSKLQQIFTPSSTTFSTSAINNKDNNGVYLPTNKSKDKLPVVHEEIIIDNKKEDTKTNSNEKINDEVNEAKETHIFIYCIHCTSMIMTMTTDKVPFSIFHNKNITGKSVIIGTTCRSCSKKYKFETTDNSGNKLNLVYNSFKTANISSKFLETSHIFKLANMIAQRDVTITKDDNNCLLYEKRDTILDEINDKCYIVGIKVDASPYDERNNILMVFLPGGFL